MSLRGKQIRIDDSLWEALARVGRDLGIVHHDHGNHSRLIREIVSASVIRWLESPYICKSSRYQVLVTGEGHVFLRQVQVLKLNRRRERLPCLIEMKPEKRREFFTDKSGEEDDAAFFRSRWLINYFGVWHGSDISSGEFLSAWVDRHGIDAKQADLFVDQDPGSILTREIVVGAQEYVQRREKGRKHEYDRVGFPMDIPSRNLDALVVVDMDLYRGGSLPFQEIPLLDLEFRNRESARFEGEGISHDAWNPMKSPLVGKHLNDAPDPHAERILEDLATFKQRIEALAQLEVANEPVVPPEQMPVLQRALKIPEQFLYYKLGWPSPYFGVEVGIRWHKPEKYYRQQAQMPDSGAEGVATGTDEVLPLSSAEDAGEGPVDDLVRMDMVGNRPAGERGRGPSRAGGKRSKRGG